MKRTHHPFLAVLTSAVLATFIPLKAASNRALTPAPTESLSEDQQAVQVDETGMVELVAQACARHGVKADEAPLFFRISLAAGEIERAQGAEAAIQFLAKQGKSHPEILWAAGSDFVHGQPFASRNPEAALKVFSLAAEKAQARPRLSQFADWLAAAAESGGPDDFRVIDIWIQKPAYAYQRWLRPLRGDHAGDANVLARAVEEGALGALHRGCANKKSPSLEELARAKRLLCLAMQLGSTAALHELESPAFSALPQVNREVARALLEASTLNAPLAVPFLEKAVAQGDNPSELSKWKVLKTGKPTPRLQRILDRRKAIGLASDSPQVEYQTYATDGSQRVDLGWLPFETAFLVRAAKAGDKEASDLLVRHDLMLPGLIGLTPDEWVEATRATMENRNWEAMWYAVEEAPGVLKQGERFWREGEDTWHKAAATLTELAGLLITAEVPPGRQLESLEPLLEFGVAAGHGAAFDKLIDLRLESSDAFGFEQSIRKKDELLLALSRTLLDQNLCNAVYLERSVMGRFTDETRLVALFREYHLLKEESTEPTDLLLYLREFAEKELRGQTLFKGDSLSENFFAVERDFRLGSVSEALSLDARLMENELALGALKAAGIPPDEPKELEVY